MEKWFENKDKNYKKIEPKEDEYLEIEKKEDSICTKLKNLLLG